MRAIFDGVTLSLDTFAAGETWQTRFTIRGEQASQISRPARAEYARVYARGARLHTIDLVFIPPPAADLHTAFEELALHFSNLPQQGDLALLSGTKEVTFPDACLVAFTPPPRRGIANEFPLRFLAGESSNATLSTLAMYDIRYPANLFSITGLTGGTATDLDGYTTTDVSAGFRADITPTIGGIVIPKSFRLITDPDPGGTVENIDPATGALIIIPDDYDETTNPKIWVDVSL